MAGGLATAVLAGGCGSGSSSSAGSSTTATSASASSQSSTASSIAAQSSSSSSTVASTSSTSTTAGAGLKNLTVTDAVRSDLVAAFVAFRGFHASDISGTRPGSVYEAEDLSSGTYWALADFSPSASAPQQVLVGMQDGGQEGLFKKVGAGGSWTVSVGSAPTQCAQHTFFPAAVVTLWALAQAPPACG